MSPHAYNDLYKLLIWCYRVPLLTIYSSGYGTTDCNSDYPECSYGVNYKIFRERVADILRVQVNPAVSTRVGSNSELRMISGVLNILRIYGEHHRHQFKYELCCVLVKESVLNILSRDSIPGSRDRLRRSDYHIVPNIDWHHGASQINSYLDIPCLFSVERKQYLILKYLKQE